VAGETQERSIGVPEVHRRIQPHLEADPLPAQAPARSPLPTLLHLHQVKSAYLYVR
jgi:hypothetical protein